MFRLCLLLCSFGLFNAVKVTYTGHKVLRVIPKSEAELIELQNFRIILDKNRIDIWRPCHGVNAPLDFRLGPKDGALLNELKLPHSVLIPDVQLYADYVMKSNQQLASRAGAFDYGVYHPLKEIMDWMQATVTQYSTVATMFSITESFEGRPLKGIKISVNPRPGKPGIWLEGGIHAREWISPATVIYMTNQLLEQNNKDPDVTAALNEFDIYIVPVVNVDGYEYSWNTDRMWRKTRSKNEGTTCVGVDPNRNWDIHWCETGASKDPCSDSYCGPSAFSEKVVSGIANYIQNHTLGLKGFIDFHSYSQLWMTPWGYTKDLPMDFETQNASSAAAVAALESVHGTKYNFGTIANIIYVASGSSADWTYGKANITYSVGVELRDTGKFGFLLPPDQIVPSGQETIRALLSYMNYITNNI